MSSEDLDCASRTSGFASPTSALPHGEQSLLEPWTIHEPDNCGELLDQSLTAAGDALTRRDITACEIVQAALDRHRATRPELHTFITVDVEGALAAAAVADSEIERGRRRGPLHGVPVAVKDNLANARASDDVQFAGSTNPGSPAAMLTLLQSYVMLGLLSSARQISTSSLEYPKRF